MKISAAKNKRRHHLFVEGRSGVHNVGDTKI